MTNAIAVKIPDMKTELQLSPAWMQTRDELISEVEGITVEDELQFDTGSSLLNRITKHDRGLEKIRKEYAKPFQDAAKAIKAAADGASDELRKKKKELQAKLETYAAAARKAEAEARREAEKVEQEKVEAALARHQELVDVGLADEDDVVEAPPTEMVVPEAQARNSSVRSIEDVKFEVTDEEKIPRAFLSVDEKKIREYIRTRKEEIKTRLEEDENCAVISGVRMFIKLRTQSS